MSDLTDEKATAIVNGELTATADALSAARQHLDVAARIGDGSQLQPEDFPRLAPAEQARLYRVAPDTYRELRDGKPGQWRPTGGTR